MIQLLAAWPTIRRRVYKIKLAKSASDETRWGQVLNCTEYWSDSGSYLHWNMNHSMMRIHLSELASHQFRWINLICKIRIRIRCKSTFQETARITRRYYPAQGIRWRPGGDSIPRIIVRKIRALKMPCAFRKTQGILLHYNSMNYRSIWRPQGGSNPCYRRERPVS